MSNEIPRYDVLILDPPWPMQKIRREVRPNQTGFDYQTMTVSEIVEIGRRAVAALYENAHVFLWVTNHFIPESFKILKAWGLEYKGALVWHKPGGFQAWNQPQINHEECLYARKGSPPVLRGELSPDGYLGYCFPAPRGVHSQKPELAIDIIEYATGHRAEPRE